VLETQPQALFRFTTSASEVTVQLDDDGHGGTELTLTNRGVPEPEYEEVHAGWLNVLLPLKAAADFEVIYETMIEVELGKTATLINKFASE
jgi:hypothetical protein